MLNKDDTNWCQTGQGNAHRLQLYIKNYRRLRKAESGRGGLPSGKTN